MQPGRKVALEQVERHDVDQLRLPLESCQHIGGETGRRVPLTRDRFADVASGVEQGGAVGQLSQAIADETAVGVRDPRAGAPRPVDAQEGLQGDRGGNSVGTRATSCDSLHAVWDRCLVEERLGMHPIALAGELHADITDEQRATWLASDAVAWANESLAIAIRPEVEYCVMVDGACQYEAENRELDDGERQKEILVGGSYLDTHVPVVRERMALAGVRLAGLLNQALGAQTPETSLRTEMLGRIETISRELDELRNAIEAIKP